MSSVLIVGESSMTTFTHMVGFDRFTASFLENEAAPLRHALEAEGHEVSWMPAHAAQEDFPLTLNGLASADIVVLSDVGANTLLLHPDAYLRDKTTPNRLKLIRGWTMEGGALVMCGGYLSFSGFGARAFYRGTPVEEVLRVRISPYDDRVETPEGAVTKLLEPEHPILKDLGNDWPTLLGYNRVEPDSGSTVLATINDDPLLLVGEPGAGRVLSWTSDVGPHWCPNTFTDWEGYRKLWNGAVSWLCRTS